MLVREYFGTGKTKGDIGIEIETEGRKVDRAMPMGWRAERDGSLRGNSVEFVLKKPVSLCDVHKYVTAVNVALRAVDAEPEDTGRAGVHVHLNMQEYTITQAINVVTAYMIFEDILTDFCGEHRVGNLFCLRLRDADGLLFSLREKIVSKMLLGLDNNRNRYAAINIESLAKFGSLEFRAMRSTVDADEISNWAGLLTAIKDWAVQFKDPRDIVFRFSEDGPYNVFYDVFQQYAVLLEYDEDSLYEGVRNAQYLAFCTDDWEFNPYVLLEQAALKGMNGYPYKEKVKTVIAARDQSINYVNNLRHHLLEFQDKLMPEGPEFAADFEEVDPFGDEEDEEINPLDLEIVRAQLAVRRDERRQRERDMQEELGRVERRVI